MTDLEKPREHGENRQLDKVGGVIQHLEHWPPSDFLGHSLIKLWDDGRYGLHLHFRTAFCVGHLPAQQYCVRFENGSKYFDVLDNRFPSGAKHRLGDHDTRANRRQRSVLVPIGNRSNLSEQRGCRPTPTMVWLQALDECPHSTSDTGHHVARPAKSARLSLGGLPPAKFGKRVYDRELDLALFFGNRNGEQPHEVVERGSELVCGFSDKDAEVRRRRVDSRNSIQTATLAVYISPASIGYALPEFLGCSVEGLSMFMSPPELPEDVVEFYRQRSGGHVHDCAGKR